MSQIITYVFYFLVLIILSATLYVIYTKLRSPELVVPKVDVTLSDVNKFIKRETLFNFISWFNSKVTVKNMSNPDQASSLITDLKTPETIQQKMQTITAYIQSTMSPALKASFYAVYNRDAYTDPDEMLTTYIARHVMFYIRKVNVDITELFTSNPNDPTDKLLKLYVISLENEIYKNNDIEVIKTFSDTIAENNKE